MKDDVLPAASTGSQKVEARTAVFTNAYADLVCSHRACKHR